MWSVPTDIETVLKEKVIVLPVPQTPMGSYVPGVMHTGALYLSGQGPLLNDGSYAHGVVGRDVSVEEDYGHVRLTELALFSAAKGVRGSLERIDRLVSVFGMVNAVPGFSEHPKVINGCQDLFVEVFGVAGRHSRAAVGISSLPMGISVEITAQMAVKP